MHVLLIAPVWRAPWHKPVSAGKAIFPPLGLLQLGALTPGDYEVTLVDEGVESLDLNASADLVAISAMTAQAPRAYEIGAAFRERGVPVVLGGMHPSARPQEALRHADAVVVGEAESVWSRVLEDARAGRLRGVYRSDTRPDPADIPSPRRDLLRPNAYVSAAVVQASRGCPFECSFCAVSRFFGRSYRVRPIETVMREVAALPERIVFFVDDNIMAMPTHAKALFGSLKELGKQWFGQASLTMLKDAELLRLAARSGCKGLFVGMESLSQAALERWGKAFNAAAGYRQAIRQLHDLGIGVIGSFMFGGDDDDSDVFERTVEFAERSHLDAAQLSILTPLPGTRLYEEMEREGRLVERNWAKYDGGHVVFRPRAMSVEKLQEGFNWALARVYSIPGILRRTWDGWLTRPLFTPMNLGFRRHIRAYLQRRREEPAPS